MYQFMSILMNAYLDSPSTIEYIQPDPTCELLKKPLQKEGKDVIGEATTTVMSAGNKGTLLPNKLESTYNRWLNNVDIELEAELKSEHFTSPTFKIYSIASRTALIF